CQCAQECQASCPAELAQINKIGKAGLGKPEPKAQHPHDSGSQQRGGLVFGSKDCQRPVENVLDPRKIALENEYKGHELGGEKAERNPYCARPKEPYIKQVKRNVERVIHSGKTNVSLRVLPGKNIERQDAKTGKKK